MYMYMYMYTYTYMYIYIYVYVYVYVNVTTYICIYIYILNISIIIYQHVQCLLVSGWFVIVVVCFEWRYFYHQYYFFAWIGATLEPYTVQTAVKQSTVTRPKLDPTKKTTSNRFNRCCWNQGPHPPSPLDPPFFQIHPFAHPWKVENTFQAFAPCVFRSEH